MELLQVELGSPSETFGKLKPSCHQINTVKALKGTEITVNNQGKSSTRRYPCLTHMYKSEMIFFLISKNYHHCYYQHNNFIIHYVSLNLSISAS